jgi:hypothetical protein
LLSKKPAFFTLIEALLAGERQQFDLLPLGALLAEEKKQFALLPLVVKKS